jgi:hypothetical protein
MQVLCVRTTEPGGDAECPVCHTHYQVYYSRQDRAECAHALKQVMAALLADHAGNPSQDAHPADAFNVPAWNGPVHASGAALLCGVRLPALNRPEAVPAPVATQWQRVC